MVAILVRLKLSLLRNTLRRSVWRTVGLIVGLVYALGVVVVALVGLIALRWTSVAVTADVTVLAFAALTAGWLLLSLLVFGVDETVDPARFALLPVRARELIASLPAQAWRVRTAGDGAKGQRRYSWARARVTGMLDPVGEYWLLARRSISDPTEIAYHLCFAPPRTGLAELARITGTRWAIEETFQSAKGQTGLDQYQVRQYTGWYRHITLAMLAHAFLTVTRARAAAKRGATSAATAS